jgi:hypothetical protein
MTTARTRIATGRLLPVHGEPRREKPRPPLIGVAREMEIRVAPEISARLVAHLDQAYILPFLGRTEEAKEHVVTLLKRYPSRSIAEADALYRLFRQEPAYREKMAGDLRQAGLPEGEANSN